MIDLRPRFEELDQLEVPDMRADIQRRSDGLSPLSEPLSQAMTRWWRGPLAAAAAAAAVLVAFAVAMLTWRGGADDVVNPTEPTPVTTIPASPIVPAPGIAPGAADDVFDLALAPDGRLWAATAAGVVMWDLENAAPSVFSEADGLGSPSVSHVAVASDGTVWAVGDSWLARYDGSWALVDGVDADRLTPVGDLAVGPDGAVWVAAEGTALVRVDADGATTHPLPEDLGEGAEWMRSIAVDGSGTVWMSVIRSGVLAFDGEWRHHGVLDGLPSVMMGNVAVAPDETVWVGGDGLYGGPGGDVPAAGIARFDGSSWTTFTTADGLLGNDGDVVMGPDGAIWVIHTGLPDEVAETLDVSHPSGLSRYDGVRWVTYPDAPVGRGGAAISADGTLWLGSGDGIVGFDGTTATRLIVGTDGVPPVATVPGAPVRLERVEELEALRLATSIGEIEFTTWAHPEGEEPPWSLITTAGGVIGGMGPDGNPSWSLDGITWTEIPVATHSSGWSRPPTDRDVLWSVSNGVLRATWDGAGWVDVEVLLDSRLDGAQTTLGSHGIVAVRNDRVYFWDGGGFAEAAQPPDPSLYPGSSPDCAAAADWLGSGLMKELGPVVATDAGFIALAARNEDDWHRFPVCEPLVWFSPDGSVWQPFTNESPFGPGAIVRDLSVAGDRIVAVGGLSSSQVAVWVSDDGVTWQRSDLVGARILGVAGSARGWIAVGSGNRMWFSPDAIVW
ncbi:MAG: hypothetical protein QNJ88_15445, partial [Acidimicrobiia bacterium]|nr:hypothetical protein [Acidimicrobiia bacterium]